MGIEQQKREQENTELKLRFYFMSLLPLFFLIFLLTVDPICFSEDAHFIGFEPLLKKNWLALFSLLCVILGLITARFTEGELSGAYNPPYEIESIENKDYEYLTFLTTCIIPLISIDLTEVRYVVVLLTLLVLIGYILIRMDLYYGNPTLALMGYRLYRAKIKGESDSIVLISKDRLSRESSIRWIRIDRYIWVVKEMRNDNGTRR